MRYVEINMNRDIRQPMIHGRKRVYSITTIVLVTPRISRKVVVLVTLPLLVTILVVNVPLITLLLVIIVG